jgi:hypothetical protein
MNVRFIRAWKVYSVGDVIDVPDGMATELVNIGRVVRETERQQLIETAAVEPAEARTADVTPRRKRR